MYYIAENNGIFSDDYYPRFVFITSHNNLVDNTTEFTRTQTHTLHIHVTTSAFYYYYYYYYYDDYIRSET